MENRDHVAQQKSKLIIKGLHGICWTFQCGANNKNKSYQVVMLPTTVPELPRQA